MAKRSWVLVAVLAAALAALVAGGGADAGLAAAQRLGGSAFAPSGPAQNGNSSSVWGLWGSGASRRPHKDKQQLLAELHAENVWKNDLVLWVLPAETRAKLPMVVQVRAARVLNAAWSSMVGAWAKAQPHRTGGGSRSAACVVGSGAAPPCPCAAPPPSALHAVAHGPGSSCTCC